MFQFITDLSHTLLSFIKDDPVRPEIPVEQRVNSNSRIFVLKDAAGEPLAVTCVKFLAEIPANVEDLANTVVNTNTAVFYTIWSYAAGAGKRLIEEAQKQIKEEKPEVTTYVYPKPQD